MKTRAKILIGTLASSLVASALVACGDGKRAPTGEVATSGSSAPSSEEATSAAPSASPETSKRSPIVPKGLVREGQTLSRVPDSGVLYVADEDHQKLHRVPIVDALAHAPPLVVPPTIARIEAKAADLALPGRPAQVLAIGDRVLVTIRDPGLLLVVDGGETPKEIARVALPADAWGVAVSPDLATAYVTSAWTHSLSAVDLRKNEVKWTLETAREPRGVAASSDGKTVYVSHLVGADLTVVDVSGEAPKLSRVAFPPAPLAMHVHERADASLGYAALLSPDGRRLFVARHALGAGSAWQGASTVDVFSTALGEPAAPERGGAPLGNLTKEDLDQDRWGGDSSGERLPISAMGASPRAMVYRKKTDQLLVVSEGMSNMVELDARSLAPAAVVNRTYALGGLVPEKETEIQIPPDCGAPSGIALSDDELVAWVHCRTTDNLVAVRLTPNAARARRDEYDYVEGGAYHRKPLLWGPFAYASLVEKSAEPTKEELAFALGRRLYFDATEPVVSGGMACAGCHPDGRDDGHVWREILKYTSDKRPTFIAGASLAPQDEEGRPDNVHYGVARQTPMIAGRVDAPGPYGWHAESPDLVKRLIAGFSLHRWWDRPTDDLNRRHRAEPIAIYLRKGLVPPPRPERELTEEEKTGKAIFESPEARCSTCHVPKTGFTDRSTLPVALVTPKLFDEDPNKLFKVPSLLYVGGTPPYYHDGSFETLDRLVDENKDRMGKTSHLKPEERRALVAYLKTL